jgi:alpha-L-fucosidase
MNTKKFKLHVICLVLGLFVTISVNGQTATAQGQKSKTEISSKRKKSKFSHKLPDSDRDYSRLKNYIEDEPVAEYDWASDKAYEDFLDMKYGIRIHWGLYSIWKIQSTSWPFLGNRNPPFDFAKRQEYNELYKTWNPQGFNADEWMDLFKECGMKMFAFTTKHHEGFSMYDTKTTVKQRVNWTAPGGPKLEACDIPYSIMQTPFKRDVVKELTTAARKRDIKIDLYYSHTDFYDADFRPYGYHPLQIPSSDEYSKAKSPDEEFTEYERAKERLKKFMVVVPDPTVEEQNRMIERHRAQLKELLTNYGKIDMMCLDIWLGPKVWPQLRQTMLELRKIQPNVMFRARGIGNYGDYYTPEEFVPGGKENSDVPWFVIYPLGGGFSYDDDPKAHKGAKWIIHNLIESASKGGNFMVAIGPDGEGRFLPEAVNQIKQAGKWLKANGDGIYKTRAREGELWKEGDNVRFTRSKDRKTIFVHCKEWPGEKLTLSTIKANEVSKVSFLFNKDTKLSWNKKKAQGLVINTPKSLYDAIPEQERLAYTFKVELK